MKLLYGTLIITFGLLSASPIAFYTEFAQFKQAYNKHYSPSEEARRFICFAENMKKISEYGPTHGVNVFADLCESEFREQYLSTPFPPTTSNTENKQVSSISSIPTNVDWRSKGVVPPVRNQGTDASVVAFAAIDNAEAQWAMTGNGLVGLSVQEVTVCAGCENNGCLFTAPFEWTAHNGGLDSAADWPMGKPATCDAEKIKNKVAKFQSTLAQINKTEIGLATWCAENGPLAIAIDASMWQTYVGGIYSSCGAHPELDHAVMVVGYGVQGATPYWILKNSWGTSWGEHGYMRLLRGSNQCGVASMPESLLAAK